jgi:hypothetical protein
VTTSSTTRAPLIAALVAAVVYLPTLANQLVWDDRLGILANAGVHDLRTALAYFGHLHGIYYRPLVLLTFAFDNALWGDRAWGYHLTNLLVHVFNVFLLVQAATRSGLSAATALWAGALFAVHPLQTDAVAYVSGRTDLLMTTGALLAFRALQAQRSASVRGLAAAVGAAVAILSKESGYATVALVVGWSYYREREWSARLRLAVPSLIIGVILLIGRPGQLPWPADGSLPIPGVVAIGRTLGTYLVLLLWPANLQIDRLTSVDGTLLGSAGAVVLVALFGAGVVWGLCRRAHNSEWVVWSVAFYLPAANLMALYPRIADRWLFTPEHNLYAAVAGLAVIIAVASTHAIAAARAPYSLVSLIASVLVLACAARTVVRLQDWRDEAHLFASAVASGSASPRVWYNHGNALAQAGRWSDAAEAYRTTVRMAPHDIAAWSNLGVVLQRQGLIDAAVDAYTHAAGLAPPSAQLLENLGTAQLRRGDVAAARASFTRALAIEPQREMSRQALSAIDQPR